VATMTREQETTCQGCGGAFMRTWRTATAVRRARVSSYAPDYTVLLRKGSNYAAQNVYTVAANIKSLIGIYFLFRHFRHEIQQFIAGFAFSRDDRRKPALPVGDERRTIADKGSKG
jgi:hypothetical protein